MPAVSRTGRKCLYFRVKPDDQKSWQYRYKKPGSNGPRLGLVAWIRGSQFFTTSCAQTFTTVQCQDLSGFWVDRTLCFTKSLPLTRSVGIRAGIHGLGRSGAGTLDGDHPQ